jgi:hypothetical protein
MMPALKICSPQFGELSSNVEFQATVLAGFAEITRQIRLDGL